VILHIGQRKDYHRPAFSQNYNPTFLSIFRSSPAFLFVFSLLLSETLWSGCSTVCAAGRFFDIKRARELEGSKLTASRYPLDRCARKTDGDQRDIQDSEMLMLALATLLAT